MLDQEWPWRRRLRKAKQKLAVSEFFFDADAQDVGAQTASDFIGNPAELQRNSSVSSAHFTQLCDRTWVMSLHVHWVLTKFHEMSGCMLLWLKAQLSAKNNDRRLKGQGHQDSFAILDHFVGPKYARGRGEPLTLLWYRERVGGCCFWERKLHEAEKASINILRIAQDQRCCRHITVRCFLYLKWRPKCRLSLGKEDQRRDPASPCRQNCCILEWWGRARNSAVPDSCLNRWSLSHRWHFPATIRSHRLFTDLCQKKASQKDEIRWIQPFAIDNDWKN